MNNYKQKVYSVLDGLSQYDVDRYIKDRNINLKRDKLIADVKKYTDIKKSKNHVQGWQQKINDDLFKSLESYHNLGQAYIIAFVLECFYDDKYKIKDLKRYMHEMMKSNSELQEMVYDFMKDYN